MIKYVNVECWSGREDIPVEEVLRGLNGFQVANVTHRHYILCYVVSSVCGLIWCTVVRTQCLWSHLVYCSTYPVSVVSSGVL